MAANGALTLTSVYTQLFVLTPSTTTSATPSGTITSTMTLTSTSTIHSSTPTTLTTSTTSAQSHASSEFLPLAATALATTMNGGGSSSTIGLSIGIPISILVLFLILILGWFLWKRKVFARRRQQDEPYKEEDNHLDHTLSNPYERYTKHNYTEHIDKEKAVLKSGPRNPISVEKNWFRKSFLTKAEADLTQVTPSPAEPPRGNAGYGRFSGFISPMILKKFNLSSGPENNLSTESLQRTASPPLPSLLKKPLPFPPVVNAKPNTPSSLRNMEQTVVSDTESYSKRVQSLEVINSVVVRPYKKTLNDELNIAIGDKLQILKTHSDGWCVIRKLDGSEGMVPKLCLKYKSSSKT